MTKLILKIILAIIVGAILLVPITMILSNGVLSAPLLSSMKFFIDIILIFIVEIQADSVIGGIFWTVTGFVLLKIVLSVIFGIRNSVYTYRSIQASGAYVKKEKARIVDRYHAWRNKGEIKRAIKYDRSNN